MANAAPDALILDVNLPDMSGFDIARQLRADANTALLPLIHVSAASIETNDIITGLDAGGDAYLIHPVDPDVLLATLRTLLRVRDTERALRDSEARFREIFFHVAAPIAVLDAELQLHECNHAFELLIGGASPASPLSQSVAAGAGDDSRRAERTSSGRRALANAAANAGQRRYPRDRVADFPVPRTGPGPGVR